MPELLKNDDKSVRKYILNDVLEKVPVDKSYENLCKVIGNDPITFYDFQFWYYRFLGGKQDLDFDRSSEPEPLQFSDLPVDAVRLIVDKLEMVERLMLRRVSKPLQEFIEKQVFDCTSIGVSFGDDLIYMSYGSEEVFYAKNDEAVKSYEKSMEFALRQFYIETNPKMLECVEVGVLSTFLAKLEYALKSLKHQISVEKFLIRPEHPDDVLAILPYLKPGYLETIYIDCKRVDDDWDEGENLRKVEQIIHLDQWKQAKKLSLSNSLNLFPSQIFATSPVFEYCYLSIREPCYDSELDFIGVPGPPAKDYRSVRHYMIPNTDKLLVFKERYGDIEIEKKTRDAQ